MSEPLSADVVRHVAALSCLQLTEEEVEQFTSQLGVVLERAKDIEALNIADVPPSTHAVPVVNVFREDVVRPSLSREDALAGAPAAEDGRFRVPKIQGEEP